MKLFILASLLLASSSVAGIHYKMEPIGTGILSSIHHVSVGAEWRVRSSWGQGTYVTLGDEYADTIDGVRRDAEPAGLIVFDSMSGLLRKATSEEKLEYKSQLERAEDPEGSRLLLKNYIENALKNPVSIETFEDIEQKLEQYRRILRYLLER